MWCDWKQPISSNEDGLSRVKCRKYMRLHESSWRKGESVRERFGTRENSHEPKYFGFNFVKFSAKYDYLCETFDVDLLLIAVSSCVLLLSVIFALITSIPWIVHYESTRRWRKEATRWTTSNFEFKMVLFILQLCSISHVCIHMFSHVLLNPVQKTHHISLPFGHIE